MTPTPMPVTPTASPAPTGPPWWLRYFNAHRKALVAYLGAFFPLATHYLGGVPIPHVWYVVVTGLVVGLGVHAVPNA